MVTSENHWNKLSPKKLEMAAKLYRSGFSIKETAEYFDVSRQNLSQLFKKHKIVRPAPEIPEHIRTRLNEPDIVAIRERDRKMARAWRLVMVAIKKGLINPQPCEVCGEEKSQAHHDDYSKPLEVRWLCNKHHRQWHAKHGKSPA